MHKVVKDGSTRNAKVDIRHNKSGYLDSTAYEAIRKIDKEKQDANILIELIKKMAKVAGFEVIGRIEIRNKKTGVLYK
ncbi:TPA: hypothetical protein MJC92_000237 [Clostridioides difficile]|uniref:hypothetical protein n=1 Tax=Clostridioides difficile TaxID=1496 RepID=UPI00038D8256|nr:hypothetical protein [Clostridioides difficile]EQG35319.1 hypothetical protein QIK_3941 [Clostridioides difficile DA00126]EQG92206.1 hypothetical protein QKK_2025 [Clostridioides difficile DA00191]MBY1307215.1 hypothetical protein [Clostridioides difficile]MCL1007219.1 hypothetical protein [Clostridioides difficile]MCR1601217.1 hypothetical protein [Clostridioides difficile]